jgi:cation transport regulator ChaB
MAANKRQAGDEGPKPPQTILRSDQHAQDIWMAAHDSAIKTYGEGGRAHRVAYAALKHVYEKQGDRWVKKAENGPSDPQAARGPTTEIKSTDEPRAPTARGQVAKIPSEAKEKAREAHREAGDARHTKKETS